MDNIDISRTTYDKGAEKFAEWYWSADLSEHIKRVLKYVPVKGRMLDLGCGPGRDLLSFSEIGFDVVGFDLSRGLLGEARKRTEAYLVQGNMLEMPFCDRAFDFIWASASLLHVPKQLASQVLQRINCVLKLNGVLFIAVKKGKGDEMVSNEVGERFFVYFSVEEIGLLLREAGIKIIDLWVNQTQHADWINVVAGLK